MIPLSAPYLELGYYIESDDALRDLVDAAVAAGFVLTGTAVVSEGRLGPGIFDSRVEKIETSDISSLFSYSRHRTVVQVEMKPPLPVPSSIATRTSIGAEAWPTDSHPVAVWLSAEPLDQYPVEITGLFQRLAEETSPRYGAITVDQALPSPHELRDFDDQPALLDFFADVRISSVLERQGALGRLEEQGCRVERSSAGVFVWTGRFDARRRRDLNEGLLYEALDVTRAVGSLLRPRSNCGQSTRRARRDRPS